MNAPDSKFDPTYARLSFCVPPERMAEFEAAYREKILPSLKSHGLVESSERGRATPDSIFDRLFEFRTPSEVAEVQEVFRGDSALQEVLRDLGAAYGTVDPNGLIQHGFSIYAAPAGPGKVVSDGRGKGHWRTYSVMDGLPSGARSILQDREGNLWFGTDAGVSRYDGQTFTTFSKADGLASDEVLSHEEAGYTARLGAVCCAQHLLRKSY